MVTDAFDLERFVAAQRGGTHERAVAELRDGSKRNHWMWFVFPQLQGLGHSANARRYGLAGLGEARAYLAHPVLGPRLHECASVLAGLDAELTARDVLGTTDAMKLRSSLTLFARAAGADSIFERLLARYFDGEADELTVSLLQRGDA
jgi:uncharacterized protein (DUF1810 family)